MSTNQPSPLQASFWLTNQEKIYITAICAIFLIGLAARYLYLKNETPKTYSPAGIEEAEEAHE